MSSGARKDSQPSGGEAGLSEEGAVPPVEAYRQLCSHYTRGCSFVSPCCGKVYPCRLCHNEQEDTHEIDRYKVSEVVCRKCETRQLSGASCSECGISFGRYFCSVCHLYADEDKQQFHCDKCGLCRVGGQQNFFHCDTCGYCLGVSMKEKHICRRQASRDNCPICMEDLHTSRSAMHVPDCGHLLHQQCFHQMIKKGLYQCPQCQRSLTDMNEVWKRHDEERQVWQLPHHLRNFKVKVQCRDCREESQTDFHVVGFKCGNCGSYNTVRCGSEELPEDRGGAGEGAEGEGEAEGEEAGGGGGAMRMINALLEIARVRREMRQQQRGEEGEEDETDDGESMPSESDGEGDIAEEEEEEDSDGRDSPPHHPQTTDNESYDGDESASRSSVDSHTEGNPAATPIPAAATGTQAVPDPDLAQATAGPQVEPNAAQPTVSAARWYGNESSSEQEWPMSLPVALDHSDWSSFTHSDSHSLHSDSSWETEEEEVIIGGSPHDLPPNESRDDQEGEDWDSELGNGGATATLTSGVLPSTTNSRASSLPRSLDAYDAHIRLDQNGTASDDSLAWETANDDNTPHEPLSTNR